MPTKLYYNAFVPAFSNIGVAIAEAKLYFYYTATITPAPIYADAAGLIPLPNPVVANLAGKYPDIYLDENITYRARQTDKNNNPIGDDVDPYIPGTPLKGEKGDPGGNVQSVGLFVDFPSITSVPAGTNIIYSSGWHTNGKGRAAYKRKLVGDPALPAWGQGVFWQQLLDGSQWSLNEVYPTSDMFGTFGDGVKAFGSDTVTGTDVTVRLNNFTRYLQLSGRTGILSRGVHRVSDTILFGRGESFASVRMIGETYKAFSNFSNNPNFPTSAIATDKNDRPAIAVSGARDSLIKGIGISGPLTKHINDNRLGLCVGAGPVVDDRFQSAWLPPSGPHSDGQFNPGAGVAVDPYAGVSPGGSAAYPAPPYSAAAGEVTTPYGRVFSSGVYIEDCTIEGFSVGVAVQPCNADGNGDFVRTPDCLIQYCITVMSVGNSQSRSLDTSNLNWVFCHTILSGVRHGLRRGYVAGNHSNWTGGHQICLVDYSSGFTGSLVLSNPYFEGGYRIASIAGQDGVFRIEGGTLALYLDAGSELLRGRPLNHIGVSATSADNIGVKVEISATISVASLFIINSRAAETNITINARERSSGSPLPQYAASAHNCLAGGIAVNDQGGANRNTYQIGANYLLFDVSSSPNGLAPAGTVLFDGIVFHAPSRNLTMPHYARWVRPSAHDTVVAAPPHGVISLGAGTSPNLSNRVLKMTFTGFAAAGHPERFAMLPGDVWQSNTGFWAFVTNYNTVNDEVTLLIQNGYINNVGSVSWPYGLPSAGGTVWFTRGSRRYVPSNPLWGTFTSGATGVSAVGVAQGSGAATAAATDIAAGDRFLQNSLEFGPFLPAQAEVVSVTEGTRVIATTAGQTSGRTTTMRLYLNRAPVPGVTNP